MNLVRPTIVAPDTAHWANWIDDALSKDAAKNKSASLLRARMLDAGRIPLLSWHHLEEMLCIDSEATPALRERERLGAIVDILAAEAIAFDAGCSSVLGCSEDATIYRVMM